MDIPNNQTKLNPSGSLYIYLSIYAYNYHLFIYKFINLICILEILTICGCNRNISKAAYHREISIGAINFKSVREYYTLESNFQLNVLWNIIFLIIQIPSDEILFKKFSTADCVFYPFEDIKLIVKKKLRS